MLEIRRKVSGPHRQTQNDLSSLYRRYSSLPLRRTSEGIPSSTSCVKKFRIDQVRRLSVVCTDCQKIRYCSKQCMGLDYYGHFEICKPSSTKPQTSTNCSMVFDSIKQRFTCRKCGSNNPTCSLKYWNSI